MALRLPRLPGRRWKGPGRDDLARAPGKAQVVLEVMDRRPGDNKATPWRERDAPDKRGCSGRSRRRRTRSRRAPGPRGSGRCRCSAGRRARTAARCARCGCGITQSNMSMPAPIARQMSRGRADAHQVARPVGGHVGGDLGDHRVHHLGRLADAEAAERVARRTAARAAPPRCARRRSTCTPPCTIPNRSWPGAGGVASAAARPARWCAPSPSTITSRGASRRRALVERHGDVAAEQRLDLHRPLGRQTLRRAVEVRRETSTPSSSILRRSRRLKT